MITFEEIEEQFDGIAIPAFIEKPKIFIYDCCRRSTSSKVIEIQPNVPQRLKAKNAPKNKSIHHQSNKICIYATTKYHTTPDRDDGSHLSQSIYDIFLNNEKNNIRNNNDSNNNNKKNNHKNQSKSDINYIENRKIINNLSIYEIWQLIKYETEKKSTGSQCVQYVSTQNSAVYLRKQQS